METAKALVSLDADKGTKSADGETPLQVCRRRGDTEVESGMRSQPTHSPAPCRVTSA